MNIPKPLLSLRACMLALLLVFSIAVNAQGDPDDPDDWDNDPEGVPVDGGLSVALAAGVAYGLKRVLKSKKTGEEATTDTVDDHPR
jgi:hypothetical protein